MLRQALHPKGRLQYRLAAACRPSGCVISRGTSLRHQAVRLFACDAYSLSALGYNPPKSDWQPPPPTRVLCLSTITAAAAAVDEKQLSRMTLRQRLYRMSRVLWRLTQITLIMGPVVWTAPIVYLLRNVWAKLKDRWWSMAFKSIEALGPCMVKFMQWASTRRDLLPPEVCDMLERVQWKTTPHPWQDSVKVLDTLGPDWPKKLTINQESMMLGSGSIAQVYKGIAHYQDPDDPTSPPLPRAVAVKVLHPRIKEQVELDLDLMRTAARYAETGGYLHWWSLKEFVEEFAHIMHMQLDLSQEARNLDRFRENFKNRHDVIFPEPIHLLTNRFVLTEEQVHGTPISKIIQDNTYDAEEKKRLARIGLRAFLKMVFLDNFVHGDLHPGNIYVTTSSEDRSKPNLTFIDAGLVTELTDKDRRNFIDLFYAIAMGKGEEAGMLMIERAREQDCKDPVTFCRKIGEVVNEAVGSGLMLSKIRVGILLQRVLSLCLQYRVKLESHFASTLLAIGVLEGVGRSLDPDLDLLREATPVIVKSHLYYEVAPESVKRFIDIKS